MPVNLQASHLISPLDVPVNLQASHLLQLLQEPDLDVALAAASSGLDLCFADEALTKKHTLVRHTFASLMVALSRMTSSVAPLPLSSALYASLLSATHSLLLLALLHW